MNRFLLCLFLIIPLINCQRNQYFFSGRNSEFNVGNGNQAPLTSFTLNSYLMDTEFKEISFGISHTLFLLKNGQVFGSGSTSFGRLGFNDSEILHLTVPTRIPSLENVTSISCGKSVSLVLLNDGTVKGFGLNNFGQLASTDDRMYTFVPILLIPGIKNAISISVGWYHVLVLLADGSVISFGKNFYGEIPDATLGQIILPHVIPTLSSISQVAAGCGFSLFLTKNGSVFASGLNLNGQLGIGTRQNAHVPTFVMDQVSFVTAGRDTIYLWLNNGSIFGAGKISLGTLGPGTTDKLIPSPVFQENNLVGMYAGYAYGIFFLGNGTICVLGANSFGELGLRDLINRETVSCFDAVEGLVPYNSSSSVSENSFFHLKLSASDGNTRTLVFGSNAYGQAGLGTNVNKRTPYENGNLNGIFKLSSGISHTLTLDEKGHLRACGDNSFGQLGLPFVVQQNFPGIVPLRLGLSSISQIYVGGYHSMILLNNGSVLVFGRNNYGQLGLNIATDLFSPTLLLNLKDIKEICLGMFHSVFLNENGSVFAVGDNTYGQLGLGHFNSVPQITRIPSLKNISHIQCGSFNTYFLSTNGSIYSVGINDNSQCCIGYSSFGISFPQPISIFNSSEFYVGGSFIFFKTEDGMIQSCGKGSNGVLAQGNNEDYSNPTVVSLKDVVKIVPGFDHAFAYSSSGDIWVVGNNSFGQLGFGTPMSFNTFQKLISGYINIIFPHIPLASTSFLIQDVSNFTSTSIPLQFTTEQPTIPINLYSPQVQNMNYILLILIPVFFLIFVLLLLLGKVMKRKFHRSTSPILQVESQPILLTTEPTEVIEMEEYFEIGNIIGVGSFGAVYKGKLGSTPVANKKLNGSEASILEVEILSKLKHVHVVSFIKLKRFDDHIYLVMEYLNGGDLLNYVRKKNLSEALLLNLAIQITDGMNYLSQNDIIHGDLALRNILCEIAPDKKTITCKISDFGFSQFISGKKIYLKTSNDSPIPWKWCAPELLLHNKLTRTSDVWSFGVVLYELFSKGSEPWPKTTIHFVANRLSKKNCPPIPRHLRGLFPRSILFLMKRCWVFNFSERIKFQEILEFLQRKATYLNSNDYLETPHDIDSKDLPSHQNNGSRYSTESTNMSDDESKRFSIFNHPPIKLDHSTSSESEEFQEPQRYERAPDIPQFQNDPDSPSHLIPPFSSPPPKDLQRISQGSRTSSLPELNGKPQSFSQSSTPSKYNPSNTPQNVRNFCNSQSSNKTQTESDRNLGNFQPSKVLKSTPSNRIMSISQFDINPPNSPSIIPQSNPSSNPPSHSINLQFLVKHSNPQTSNNNSPSETSNNNSSSEISNNNNVPSKTVGNRPSQSINLAAIISPNNNSLSNGTEGSDEESVESKVPVQIKLFMRSHEI